MVDQERLRLDRGGWGQPKGRDQAFCDLEIGEWFWMHGARLSMIKGPQPSLDKLTWRKVPTVLLFLFLDCLFFTGDIPHDYDHDDDDDDDGDDNDVKSTEKLSIRVIDKLPAPNVSNKLHCTE